VAAAGFDGYAEREGGVGVFGGDGFEAVGGAGGYGYGHGVAVVVLAGVRHGDGVARGGGGEGAVVGGRAGISLQWSQGRAKWSCC